MGRATRSCSVCAAVLDNLLHCGACGALQELPVASTPFELLGLEPAWLLDATQLRKRVLTIARGIHPDFFAQAGTAERSLAQRNSAELNRAHELLASDTARADLLIALAGGPDEQSERSLPQAFLMEVLEWNELLEAAQHAAPDGPERTALASLGTELRKERATMMARVGAALEPLPQAGSTRLLEARRALNAVRYVDRTLHELEELRLTSPPPQRSA